MCLSKEGATLLTWRVQPLIILFTLDFRLPFKVNLGVLFASLLLIYLFCLVVSWISKPAFHEAIPRIFAGLTFKNWLIVMPLVSSALLLSILFIQSLQESHGIPTGALHFPNPYEALVSLSYAPVAEEIGFRLSVLGVISAIYCLIAAVKLGVSKRFLIKAFLLALLTPEKAKKITNSGAIETYGWIKGVKAGEWITLILTSVFFGLVHYLAGSGWGIGKVTSASLAGLILGLVYLRYGIHASILLHWFFNYYGYVYDLAAKKYGSVFSGLNWMINKLITILGVFALGFFVTVFVAERFTDVKV